MKLLRVGLVFVAVCTLLATSPASALEETSYTPPPELKDSPVIVTSYAVTGAKLQYVQLFNTSDAPINLAGWQVAYQIAGQDALVISELSGWIAPSNYLIVADAAIVENADFSYQLTVPETSVPISLTIVPSAGSLFSAEEIALDETGIFVRKVSPTTGNYITGYQKVAAPPSPLYGGGFYTFLSSTPLQFSEILANPHDCSPLDTKMACDDYVKLYNPSNQPIDLSQFRLRVGTKNSSATSTNTYELAGVVAPGHYETVTKSADDHMLSLSNSGDYVWLEDTFGVKRYDSTVQQYADASATSKKGEAWAYDANDGVWKWTSQPTPSDGPSVFPVQIAKEPTAQVKTYKPCQPGQYRNLTTHRCRSIASAAASTLQPCHAGQYRSPDTHRCRSLATTASTLKPCEPGQERNADTNRCRKVTGTLPDAAFAVQPIADTAGATFSWWALGGVGVLALGYGAWEWRSEAIGAIRKVGSFFSSGK